MILLRLFWSFIQVGLFSIGGGYAALPLIQEQVVEKNQWITLEEFADVITISQMTPGPIAINVATFVGIRLGGIPGAIFSTLGSVFPSIVIVLILAFIYYKYRGLSTIQGILKGLRPAVVALIGAAGLSLVVLAFWGEEGMSYQLANVDYIAVFIFILALIVLRKWKVNPIYVMIGSGVLGLARLIF